MNPSANQPTQNNVKVWGKWLKQLRKLQRITQNTLAHRCGYSPSLIQKLETGVRQPSWAVAVTLAKALNIAADQKEAFVRMATGKGLALPVSEQTPLEIFASSEAQSLPVFFTPLFGREADLAALSALLARPETRLLSLLGPPGVGKTRLGVALARCMVNDPVASTSFPDGVTFVSLAEVLDVAEIALAIVVALGLPETGDARAITTKLHAYLRTRRMLLVLDNFEHLLEGALTVSALLAAAPGLKIILTSRAALRVQAEQEYPVAPLALPDAIAPSSHRESTELAPVITPESLTQVAAVQMFVNRAQARNPWFKLTASNAMAVSAICRYTDGLPLVLELMAARTRIVSPIELARGLQVSSLLVSAVPTAPAGFVLDSLGAKDTPQRHRTLEQALTWSYALLSPRAQATLTRLSVLVGEFTPSVAETMFGITLAALEELASHSLIQVTEHNARFHLLESIRQFALYQLGALGQEYEIRQRHAAHWLAQATHETSAGVGSKDELALSGETDQPSVSNNLSNVRAALSWGLSPKGDLTLGLQLTLRMMYWFWGHGYSHERDHWIKMALQRVSPSFFEQVQTGFTPELDGQPEPVRLAAAHLIGQWLFTFPDGLTRDAAKALMKRQLALAEAHNDRAAQAFLSRSLLLFMAQFAEDDAEIPDLERSVLRLIENTSEPPLRAMMWNGIANFARTKQDLSKARHAFEQALQACNLAGDVRFMTMQLTFLGFINFSAGDKQQGIREMTNAWWLHRRMKNYTHVVGLSSAFALIAFDKKQWLKGSTIYFASQAAQRLYGISLLPAENRLIDQSMIQARANLSDEALEAARQAGQAMSVEQLMAYALDAPETDEVIER